MAARPQGLALRMGLALALGATLALAPQILNAKSRPPLQYQVRAAYLLKFLPFIEWPAAPTGSGETFGVCIVGDAPFGTELEQLAAGQQIDGRPLVIRRLNRVSRGSGCRVLYLAETAEQSASEVLRNVRGTPCLTITEDNAADDSVIQFRERDNRVRFSVNLDAAGRNGLTLSSKLLSLALSVRKGSTP